MATIQTGEYYPHHHHQHNSSHQPRGHTTHAEVPEFDISMLNQWDTNISPEEHWMQYNNPHQHTGFFKQESHSVPKTEPIPEQQIDFFPEATNWHWSSQQVQHLPMNAMAYQQDGSPGSLVQLSDPPTPAAECQVTSTNLSPMHSPYSPPSDGGSLYEGAHGESFMGEPSHFDTTDLTEINIKGLTEEQLVSLTARDLNRICREMPEDIVKQLKKRRRTLKNRGYAYNSRVRRVSQKTALETERDDLKTQIQKLTDRCRFLEKEADQWKRKAKTLERGQL